MPTVNEALGELLENAIKNPRSTVSGLLTASIGIIPVLLESNAIHGKAAVAAGIVLAASKAIWSTFFMKDSQKTLAMKPGDTVPTMVPSHGIPDDPANKVVVKP